MHVVGSNRRCRPALVFALVLAATSTVAAAACADDDSPLQPGTTSVASLPAIATSAATTPTQLAATATPLAQMPRPTVEVQFFDWQEGAVKIVRFFAVIRNPSDRALAGVRVRWDALDATGAIVGSHERALPGIPAASSLSYVGGASDLFLTGIPASVRLTVTDAGRLIDNVPASFTVEETAFQSTDFPLVPGRTAYSVSAALTSPSFSVPRTKVTIFAVLRNAGGDVIGAGFDQPTSIPDPIAPNTRFRVKVPVTSAEGAGVPASAELWAYVEP
jgi:hypothetical protein